MNGLRPPRALIAAVVACAALAVAVPTASAALSSTPEPTWGTDGPVEALARSGDTLYLGGMFGRVGPVTGPGAIVSGQTALPDTSAARVVDTARSDSYGATVQAVAPDGEGGWFVGGSFTHVGGQPHRNLAHLRADGSVDPAFLTDTDGAVTELDVWGSHLYARGFFRQIGGVERPGLAQVDRDGAVTPWTVEVDGSLHALEPRGSVVYLGGNFRKVNGIARANLASVSAFDAGVTGWDPAPDQEVDAVLATGSTAFIGGRFRTVGGEPRPMLASVRLSDGEVTDWDPGIHATPNFGGTDDLPWTAGWVDLLELDGSTLYAAGFFDELGGQPRRMLGAVDAATGEATGFDPAPDGSVSGLAVGGESVYVAGDFREIGGRQRFNLAALDPDDGTATPWNPRPAVGNQVGPAVVTVAVDGDRVYAGGDFIVMGGEDRHSVAALDLRTGTLSGWNPKLGPRGTYVPPSAEVSALAVADGTVYLGGTFGDVNDVPRRSLAAVDARDASLRAWDPGVDGSVRALEVAGSRLYVGGRFFFAGTRRRPDLAAVDLRDGTVDAWDPQIVKESSGRTGVRALDVRGDRVYFAGDFDEVGGAPRNGVAAVATGDGQVTPWAPAVDQGIVSSLLASDGGVFLGGTFDSIGGAPRGQLSQVDGDMGALTGFRADAAGSAASIDALALSGRTLHLGGRFDRVGGEPRSGAAAVDAIDGTVLSWAPRLHGRVAALEASDPRTVALGGSFVTWEPPLLSGLALYRDPAAGPTGAPTTVGPGTTGGTVTPGPRASIPAPRVRLRRVRVRIGSDRRLRLLVRYRLSRAAQVRIEVRRRGRLVVSLPRRGRQGLNTARWTKRIGDPRRWRGPYRVRIKAVDVTGKAVGVTASRRR